MIIVSNMKHGDAHPLVKRGKKLTKAQQDKLRRKIVRLLAGYDITCKTRVE